MLHEFRPEVSLSLSLSLSSIPSIQAEIVSLFLKCAWILCVWESEHLSRKLSSVVSKNSPGASVHMSFDKATHVKEPRYHSAFIALRLWLLYSQSILPSPSTLFSFPRQELKKLKRYSSFTWQLLLCFSSKDHAVIVLVLILKWICIWFKINELNWHCILIQFIGEESSQWICCRNVLFT